MNYLEEENDFINVDIDLNIDSKFLAFMDFVKYFDPIGIIGCFHKDLYVSPNNSFHQEYFGNQFNNDHYTPEIQILINFKLTF